MSIGGGAIGDHAIGGSTISSGAAPLTGGVDALKTRDHQLVQTEPYLQFFDVGTPVGTQYFVDFFDPNSAAPAPDKVRFDGNDYQGIVIERRDIVDSEDGAFRDVALTIADPTLSIHSFLNAHNGLKDQPVRVTIIPFDFLDQPAVGRSRNFTVKGSSFGSERSTVTLTLGMENLFTARSPRQRHNNHKCWNEFRDGVFCTYPGRDNFTETTRQSFRNLFITTPPRTARYGWLTQNDRLTDNIANTNWRCPHFEDFTPNPEKKWCVFRTPQVDIRQTDAVQLAPFQYRTIRGGADFDVWCRMRVPATGTGFQTSDFTRTNGMAGLMYESPTNRDRFLFWGTRYVSAGGVRTHFKRDSLLTPQAPADESFIHSGEEDYRMTRVGTQFQLFHRPHVEGQDDLANWTLRRTVTDAETPGTESWVGICWASDVNEALVMTGMCGIFKVISGGFLTCNRTLDDCDERDNTHQFNAFVSMPSRRPIFI